MRVPMEEGDEIVGIDGHPDSYEVPLRRVVVGDTGGQVGALPKHTSRESDE